MADVIFEIFAMSICSNFLSTSSSSSTRMADSGFVVICFSFVHNMRIFRLHGLHVLVKCINIHGIFQKFSYTRDGTHSDTEYNIYYWKCNNYIFVTARLVLFNTYHSFYVKNMNYSAIIKPIIASPRKVSQPFVHKLQL